MSNPLDKPDRGDRRDAKRQVEDAVKRGAIIEADGDLRIQQIESAGTVADVQAQVQDLAGRTAQAAAPVPAMAGGGAPVPAAPNPYGPVSPRIESAPATRVFTAVGKVRRRHVVPIIIALFFFGNAAVGMVTGLISAFTSDHTQTATSTPAVDMFTATAFQDLVNDLRTTTGTTQVVRAVMYASYASVTVLGPDDEETLYSWRGSLTKLTSTSRSDDQTVDLSTYQPDVVFGLIDQAKQLVVSPTNWYVIVQPAGFGDGATIYAYANDSSGTGGYVSATPDGTVVRTQRF